MKNVHENDQLRSLSAESHLMIISYYALRKVETYKFTGRVVEDPLSECKRKLVGIRTKSYV